MISLLIALSLLTNPSQAAVCGQSGTILRLRDSLSIIEKAAVPAPDKDPRYGMEQGSAVLKIRQSRAKNFSEINGEVKCPQTATEWGVVGNGFLIGEKADAVLTNAHLPLDSTGNDRLRDMSTCYFATAAEPNVHWKLRFDDSHAKIGTKRWDGNERRDFAIVKLERPVPGVQPLPFSPRASRLEVGEKVFMISRHAHLMPADRVVKTGEPVIQQCDVLGYEDSPVGDGRLLKTSCASTTISSGSMVVTGDPATDKFEVVSVHVAGGVASLNGSAVDLNSGNYATSIAVDGALKRNLESFLKTKIAPGSD